MKVIFLDVDNVLNYVGCKYTLGNMYFVDDEKLLLVKNLCDETNAKIVLSSTWRKGFYDLENGQSNTKDAQDYLQLVKKFNEYELEIFSHTPMLDEKNRGLEIENWLKNWKGEPIEKFVILDDMQNMKPYGKYLIQTSMMTGLKEKHIKKALTILNGK